MLFIDSNFTERSNNLYPETLLKIDRKIYQLSNIALNNVKFAQDSKVNYEVYEDLVVYREILENMIYCSTCLCDININSVYQRIMKLLNTPC